MLVSKQTRREKEREGEESYDKAKLKVFLQSSEYRMLSVDSHRVAHNFLQGCDYDCFKMSLQKLDVVHSCTSLARPLTFLLNYKDLIKTFSSVSLQK